MKKLTALAVLMALSGTAFAQEPASIVRTFRADGTSYEYTVTTDQRGHRDIVGRDSRGMSFALHQVGTSVTGRYGGQLVSYSVRPRRRAPVEVATRAN